MILPLLTLELHYSYLPRGADKFAEVCQSFLSCTSCCWFGMLLVNVCAYDTYVLQQVPTLLDNPEQRC